MGRAVDGPIDGPVRDLLDRIAGPAASTDPDLAAIGSALVALAADLDYLGDWVRRVGPDTGSLAIHVPARGPRLLIVHRTAGRMSTVHDHGTWVAISPIVGLETHRRWRAVGSEAESGEAPGHDAAARLELVEDLRLEPGAVATLLPPDDLHDHGHLVERGPSAHVLVLLGDDQTSYTRSEWDLTTGSRRVLLPGDPGRAHAGDPPTRA